MPRVHRSGRPRVRGSKTSTGDRRVNDACKPSESTTASGGATRRTPGADLSWIRREQDCSALQQSHAPCRKSQGGPPVLFRIASKRSGTPMIGKLLLCSWVVNVSNRKKHSRLGTSVGSPPAFPSSAISARRDYAGVGPNRGIRPPSEALRGARQ
jgi:hypothetical protein